MNSTANPGDEIAEASSDAYFRNLLESAPDAMIIIDESGRIVIANGQAITMFGYPRADLIGMQIEELMPAKYRDRHIDHRGSYIAAARIRPMGGDAESGSAIVDRLGRRALD